MSPRSTERPCVDWTQRLASALAAEQTVHTQLVATVDELRRLLDAAMGGALWTQPRESQGIHLGLRKTHVEEYLTVWRMRDPILQAMLRLRIPVRDADVFSESAWRNVPLAADLGRRVGAHSYIVVPIYGPTGSLLATIHLCRHASKPRFSVQDVQHATAFAGFASAAFGRTCTPPRSEAALLAPREYQVANLAARGLSNRAIAAQIGIAKDTVKQALSRVYQKVGVATRAELASRYEFSGETRTLNVAAGRADGT